MGNESRLLCRGCEVVLGQGLGAQAATELPNRVRSDGILCTAEYRKPGPSASGWRSPARGISTGQARRGRTCRGPASGHGHGGRVAQEGK
jgi:hypothetical protein